MLDKVDMTTMTPGRLPLEVFNEVARLTVTPVVELVIVAGDSVVLTRRPMSDQYWPGQYCLPGKIITSGGPSAIDEYAAVIRRTVGVKGEPLFAGVELYHTKRGDEIAVIYTLHIRSVGDVDLNDRFEFVSAKEIGHLDVINEHRDMLQKYGSS